LGKFWSRPHCVVARPHPFRPQTMVGEEPYRGLMHSGWLTQLWTAGAKGFELGEQRAFKVGALDDARPVWVGYIISQK
jgi:hypothetical protein